MADGAHVADVHVDVHPDTSGFERELRQQLKAMVVEARTSPDTKDFRRELQDKLRNLGDFKVLVAPDTTGFRQKLEASLRRMTAVPVKVTPDVRNFRTELRRQLTGLPSVAIDVDNTAALASVAAVGRAIRTLPTKVNLDVDTAAAASSIAALRAAIRSLSGTTVRIGVNNAAALASVAAVDRALRTLSATSVTIRVNNTAALAAIRAVDAAVSRLAGRTVSIRVTVTNAAALAALRAVDAAASRLDGRTVTATVHVNSTTAIANLAAISAAVARFGALTATATITVNLRPPGIHVQLAALHALIRSFSGLNARAGVSVNTSSARGAIQALIATAIAIGPAIIPVAAAAVAAIGAIGPAAFAAAAGIGVMALAFAGVFDAVKALGDVQSKAGKTAGQYAQQQAQIANAQDQVRDAYRGVSEAERNLANAQRDALRAQQDINRAREEAKQALEDLDSAVKNNSLSIRQAQLDLADAEKELKAVSNLPVDNRQRVEAQLRYDQARQALDDLTVRQGRLTKEQQTAAKAGVEGSEQVRSAQERAADAQERVRDAAIALTRAQEQVVSAQRNLQTTIQTTSASGGAAVDTLAQKMAALSPAGQEFARFLFRIKDEFKQVKAAAEAGLFPGLQRGIEALLPVLPQIALFVGRVATAMGNLFEAAGKALASPFWINFFDYMGQVAGPLLQALGGVIGGLARGFASLLVAFTPFSIQFTKGLAGIAQAFADWAAGLAGSNGFNAFIEYVKAEGPKVLKLLGDFVIAFVKLGIALAPLATLVLNGLVALFDWMARAKPDTLIIIAAALGAITLAVVGLGGPITVVVAALVAIAGAAAVAYTKFEPFRNAVDRFWTGLKAVGIAAFEAAKTAIVTFIDAFKRGGDDVKNTGFLGAIEQVGLQARRIFDGIKLGVENFVEGFRRGGTEIQQGGFVAYMQNLGMVARQVFEWMRDKGIPAVAAFLDWIGPKAVAFVKVTWAAFEILFTVLNRVFAGITTAIGIAWTVWSAIFTAIVWYVENYMAPVFMFFWRNVIEPVWTGIRLAISVAWALIQVVFGIIQYNLKVLGAAFQFFYDFYIKPTWDRFRSVIEGAWNFVRPIFDQFGRFINESVAPKFKQGVDKLGQIWETFKDNAKVPVKKFIDIIINGAIIGGFNWIADKVPGVDKVAKVPYPEGFATGGYIRGPGTGTSDSIMARLSNGEYVIPAAIVRQLGVSFFDQLIGKKKAPYKGADTGFGPMYKDGGFVDWTTDKFEAIANPVDHLKKKLSGVENVISEGRWVGDTLKDMTRSMVSGLVNWAEDKVRSLWSFGNDSAIMPIGANSSPGFPPWPSSPGAQRGDSGVWRGVVALIKSTGPVSGSFGNAYRHGDPKWHGSGRAVDWMGFEQDQLATFLASRGPLELIHRTRNRDYAYSRGRNRGSFNQQLMREHENHIHIAFRHGGLVGRGHDGAALGGLRVPYLFRDSGGFIPPGLSLVNNQTGRDEWMFNDSQMRELVGSRSGGSDRRRGGDVHIDNFNAYAGQSPHDIARDLDWIGRHGG